MKITKISTRRKGLSQLYIDGEEAMKLDTVTLEMNHISEGTEITDEELYELIKKSEAHRASERALYLLEYRARSKKELIDKISEKEEISREAAEIAADRMEEIGLVNDKEYAHMLARQFFRTKKYGSRRVRQEMYRKGIDRDIVDEIIEEYDEGSAEKIADILERKYPLFNEDERVKRRAVAALQRLGYNFDKINSGIRYLEEIK